MKKLILTNLDEFEPEDKDSIFLGPWCFRDLAEKEKYWNSHKFDELFIDAKEFEDASFYIRGFAENLLLKYSEKLNKIHKRENSVGYWRILLMPWIIRSLEIFFIRYKQLKNFSDEEYSVSILKDCYQHEFQNSRDFYNFLLNETGQHFSYSLLIEFLRPEKFTVSNLPDSENKIRTNHSKKIERHNAFNEFKRNLGHINRILLANLTGLYIDGIKGINTIDIISIATELKRKNISFLENSINKKDSNEQIPFKTKHKDFEDFIETVLFQFLPLSFKTDFEMNEKNAKRKLLLLSKRNKLLLIGAIMGGIDSQRFFLAQYKEQRKGKLLISQHGGLSYGISRSFPAMAMIEYKNADYFLTWGWTKHANYQVNAIPLPSPQLSKRIGLRNNVTEDLILVGTQARLVNDRLASRIQTEQCNLYRSEKVRFIKSLGLKDRDKLSYRPYFSEIDSYPEKDFLRNEIPSLKFIENDFDQKLLSARCVVIDHPGTTFDISISANIPSILFWDRRSWLFTEDGEDILDILQKARVFHPDGKSAANFINSISDEIEDWWNDNETREAINLYRSHYAMISEEWRNAWANLIKELQ